MFLKLNFSKIKSFGSSMEPLLNNEDVVFFKKHNFNFLKIDDIITIKKKNELFTHRLIYKGKNYVVSKGDNNKYSDGKIYPKQILGKVDWIKRNNQFLNVEDLYLFQSTLYFQEILKINKAFEKHKINFLFLKGLPLHLFYEKTHPRRIYVDCDILLQKNDFIKAKKILTNGGYKSKDTSLFNSNLLKDKDTEVSFFKIMDLGVGGKFPIVFDIHLEPVFLMTQIGKLDYLYPQNFINELTDKFFKEKKIVKVQGEKLPILSENNLIIYLALHFFHHNFKGIFRLEFLNSILMSLPDKTKDKILNKSADTIQQYHLENFSYPTLLLLKKYFNYKIPLIFIEKIKPKKVVLRYIQKLMSGHSIFDEESRINSGVKRFKFLFLLSPNLFLKKIITFLNPQIIYFVLMVIFTRFKKNFKLAKSFF